MIIVYLSGLKMAIIMCHFQLHCQSENALGTVTVTVMKLAATLKSQTIQTMVFHMLYSQYHYNCYNITSR